MKVYERKVVRLNGGSSQSVLQFNANIEIHMRCKWPNADLKDSYSRISITLHPQKVALFSGRFQGDSEIIELLCGSLHIMSEFPVKCKIEYN